MKWIDREYVKKENQKKSHRYALVLDIDHDASLFTSAILSIETLKLIECFLNKITARVKWIRLNDMSPPAGECVLLCEITKKIASTSCGMFDKESGGWIINGQKRCAHVTHWAEMPEAPG